MSNVPMAVVSYYPVPPTVKGMLRTRDGLQSYLRCSDYVPKSQLGDGWYENDKDVCRAKPAAELTLYRPADAREFEISLPRQGALKVTVFEDGVSLGTLSRSDREPLRWKLVPGTSGDKHIKIVSEPAGTSIGSLGYEP